MEEVDDWDKSASLVVGATPRRSTSFVRPHMKVIASFRQLPLLPKVGWALYVVSMVIPSSDLNSVGAEMFIVAPWYGVMFLFLVA